MSIQKNIGKNTIGDNNKMAVSLHEYNMSTHDLSTIVRNTQSPGTLVPNLCLVGQKGDTFDIDVDANVLTHPTPGPLFGSFKLEHHIYAAPVRLYNSWLHNNRTKIGLNMAQVKLPQIKTTLKSQCDTITTEGGAVESSKHKLFTCIPRNKRFCEHGGTNLKKHIQKRTTNTGIL